MNNLTLIGVVINCRKPRACQEKYGKDDIVSDFDFDNVLIPCSCS